MKLHMLVDYSTRKENKKEEQMKTVIIILAMYIQLHLFADAVILIHWTMAFYLCITKA